MKKSAFLLAFGLLSIAVAVRAEDLIKIETSVRPLRLARGEEGRVILKIAVKPGIAINPQPSFVVEFDPSTDLVFPKNFFTAPDLNIPLLEEGGKGRLDLRRAVEVPFTVSPKASRGIHRLEGRVKYFGISAKEGWCYKGTAKFAVTFSTRLAAPAPDKTR
jgi:hypothetical protein